MNRDASIMASCRTGSRQYYPPGEIGGLAVTAAIGQTTQTADGHAYGQGRTANIKDLGKGELVSF